MKNKYNWEFIPEGVLTFGWCMDEFAPHLRKTMGISLEELMKHSKLCKGSCAGSEMEGEMYEFMILYKNELVPPFEDDMDGTPFIIGVEVREILTPIRRFEEMLIRELSMSPPGDK